MNECTISHFTLRERKVQKLNHSEVKIAELRFFHAFSQHMSLILEKNCSKYVVIDWTKQTFNTKERLHQNNKRVCFFCLKNFHSVLMKRRPSKKTNDTTFWAAEFGCLMRSFVLFLRFGLMTALPVIENFYNIICPSWRLINWKFKKSP